MRKKIILSSFVLLFLLFQFVTIESFAGTSEPDEWSYTIADFNGDGSPDIFVASGTSKGNKVWFNNGLGEFYPSDQILDYSIVGAIATGDIDNDKDMDLFVANIDSPNQVWLNDGTGHFMTSSQTFDTRRSICVSLGDIDSDGDMDAVVAYADGTLEVFSNNGAGFFNSVQILKGGKEITSIEFKDINNDKISDIVCFRNDNTVSAFINSGNSQFSQFDGKIEATAKLAEISVDLTGDGKPDGVFINNDGEPSPANYYGDHPLLGSTGGPDNYGYVWVDTSYSWVTETANTWTAPSEDSVSGAIPLGFTFNFYGTDYTSIYISSDGFLEFSDPYAPTDWNWPNKCNTSDVPNSAAYGFGTDFDPTTGGTIYYGTQGSAPNRSFILTYWDIATVGDNNHSRFQIILYEGTNRIKYAFQWALADYGYASIGIENQDGSDRLLKCHKFCSPSDGYTVIFYVAPEIELYRSGTDMPTGSSYNFGRVAVGSNASVTFTITNTGRANLNLNGTSIIGGNAGQFGITAFPSTPVAALGGSTTVTIRFQPTAEGVMETQMQIANDDPSENPYIINLYGGGDDNAPTVDITNPTDGSTVTGTVNIDANAADDIGINHVEFYLDNSIIGTDATAPYGITYNFSALSPGSYIIKAIAYDTLNQTGMDAIKVTVPGGEPPTVAITSPADGSTVSGTVNINATATDDVGVNRVEFYLDNTIIGTDTTSPYGIVYDFSATAPGSYVIKAIAYDTINQTAVDAIKVTIAGAAPPTVDITNPADGSTVSGIVNIDATATDDAGVNRVEFYLDNTIIGTDTTAPYGIAYDFSTVAPGTYIIKAIAYDTINQTAVDAIKVSVAGTNPWVDITNPADGEAVSNIVTIEATATSLAGVDHVEFRVNGSLLCTDTTAPYQCSWDTTLLPYANYTISATAVDIHGLSAIDTITVRTTDGPPIVTITEPASGANIFGTTVIKADAWDNIKVKKVEFYVNGALICSDTEAPYECTWEALAVPVGTYTITVAATDNLAQTGMDTITVQRRVQVNLTVNRKTEKAWIIKKDYAEILVTLPDYGVATVNRLQILRSKGDDYFEAVKDVSISELQDNSIQFLDKYLDSTGSYTYKVVAFDSSWQLIGESDLITI